MGVLHGAGRELGAPARHERDGAERVGPLRVAVPVDEQAGNSVGHRDRQPDEAHDAVYRFLLQRNARLYGVHYALDRVGDIHLIGRIGLHAVTAEELDRVLGQVLEAADGDFNTLLEIGFATSIRREHAWRQDRGESLANLRAFEHLFT